MSFPFCKINRLSIPFFHINWISGAFAIDVILNMTWSDFRQEMQHVSYNVFRFFCYVYDCNVRLHNHGYEIMVFVKHQCCDIFQVQVSVKVSQ